MPANNLEQVVDELNNIVKWAKQNNSRIGYFAALYKRMTLAIRNGIAQGAFEDAARMEKLDVIFANRYLCAFENYRNNKPITSSWKKTFDTANTKAPAVIQHLLLGINTHINLDLGIAASETVPANQIESLKNDFEKVNTVISSLVDEAQSELAAIWFPMKFIDRAVGQSDEALLNFSIGMARKAAWKVATDLSALDAANKENYINNLDKEISLFALLIINPGFRLKFIFFLLDGVSMAMLKKILKY